MFRRASRLARRQDITKLIKQGRRTTVRGLALRFGANSLDHWRVTVVVGTAVHKHATVRNRLKRQLRESLKDVLSSRQEQGIDLMLTAYPAARQWKPEERRGAIEALFRQAKL